MTTFNIISAILLFSNVALKSQPADSALKDTTIRKEVAKDTNYVVVKPTKEHSSFDKIYLKNGDSLIVSIKEKNVQEVIYCYPLNTVINKMKVSFISQINYSNGKQDKFISIFDTKTSDKNDSRLYWDKVNVVMSADSVNGMALKGVVKTLYKGEELKENDKTLEKKGLIILKKKVTNLEANFLLVTHQKIYREFGEMPYIEMEGIAYKAP